MKTQEMMSFDMNEKVTVKLTNVGLVCLGNYLGHYSFKHQIDMLINKERELTMPMWQFICVFARAIDFSYMPFENTNIYITIAQATLSFNMNEKVSVKLTEEGYAYFMNYFGKRAFFGQAGKFVNEKRELTMPMWQFISIFADNIDCHTAFESNNIYFPKEHLLPVTATTD